MRFDVYSSRAKPKELYLDCQADHLDFLTTRAVVPLVRHRDDMVLVSRLHPIFKIDDEQFVMLTHAIVAVPVRSLGPKVNSLNDQHFTITGALDMLLTGF